MTKQYKNKQRVCKTVPTGISCTEESSA